MVILRHRDELHSRVAAREIILSPPHGNLTQIRHGNRIASASSVIQVHKRAGPHKIAEPIVSPVRDERQPWESKEEHESSVRMGPELVATAL